MNTTPFLVNRILPVLIAVSICAGMTGTLPAQEEKSSDPAAESSPAPKKKGLFQRLFGNTKMDEETRSKVEAATEKVEEKLDEESEKDLEKVTIKATRILETPEGKKAANKVSEAIKEHRGEIEKKSDEVLGSDDAQKAVSEAESVAADSEKQDELVKKGEELLESPEGKEKIKKAMAVLEQNQDTLTKKGEEILNEPDSASSTESLSTIAETLLKEFGGDEESAKPEPATEEAPKEDTVTASPAQAAAAEAESQSPPEKAMPAVSAASSVPPPQDPRANPFQRSGTSEGEQTKITSERSSFDSKTNLVTFEDNVKLKHPQFEMSCSTLEAELNEDDNAIPGKKAGSIKRAVAKARRAVFDAIDEVVVLSDFPILQDGPSLIEGTSETTKITLRKNGKYDVEGPAIYKTVTATNSLEGLRR